MDELERRGWFELLYKVIMLLALVGLFLVYYVQKEAFFTLCREHCTVRGGFASRIDGNSCGCTITGSPAICGETLAEALRIRPFNIAPPTSLSEPP